MNKSKFPVVPIRITSELDKRLDKAAERLGKSKQETMRLCMEVGYKWLAAHDHDPGQKIVPMDVVETLRQLLDDALGRLTSETNRLAGVAQGTSRGGRKK